jgi:hypothetical protein
MLSIIPCVRNSDYRLGVSADADRAFVLRIEPQVRLAPNGLQSHDARAR